MKTEQNKKPGNVSDHALRAGFTIEEIFNLTKFERWYLTKIKEVVESEEKPAGAKN